MKERRPKTKPAFWWSEQPGAVAWGEPGWAPMQGPDRLTWELNGRGERSEKEEA